MLNSWLAVGQQRVDIILSVVEFSKKNRPLVNSEDVDGASLNKKVLLAAGQQRVDVRLPIVEFSKNIGL